MTNIITVYPLYNCCSASVYVCTYSHRDILNRKRITWVNIMKEITSFPHASSINIYMNLFSGNFYQSYLQRREIQTCVSNKKRLTLSFRHQFSLLTSFLLACLLITYCCLLIFIKHICCISLFLQYINLTTTLCTIHKQQIWKQLFMFLGKSVVNCLLIARNGA